MLRGPDGLVVTLLPEGGVRVARGDGRCLADFGAADGWSEGTVAGIEVVLDDLVRTDVEESARPDSDVRVALTFLEREAGLHVAFVSSRLGEIRARYAGPGSCVVDVTWSIKDRMLSVLVAEVAAPPGPRTLVTASGVASGVRPRWGTVERAEPRVESPSDWIRERARTLAPAILAALAAER